MFRYSVQLTIHLMSRRDLTTATRFWLVSERFHYEHGTAETFMGEGVSGLLFFFLLFWFSFLGFHFQARVHRLERLQCFDFCDVWLSWWAHGAAARQSIAGLYLVLQPKSASLRAGTIDRGVYCAYFVFFFFFFYGYYYCLADTIRSHVCIL